MECLDDRNAALVSGMMNCGRDEREKVVHMNYVWLEILKALAEAALRCGRPQASEGSFEAIHGSFNSVVIGFKMRDFVQISAQ